jgi:hypothetical protein
VVIRTGDPSLHGMVHCTIGETDDECFETFVCTEDSLGYKVDAFKVDLELSYAGCVAHTVVAGRCSEWETTLHLTAGGLAQCEADSLREGWQGPEQSCADLGTTETHSSTIAGSTDWKHTWAANEGCRPDGAGAFFCPASMQNGTPPKLDTKTGAMNGQRAWGECYVPQTDSEDSHAVWATGSVWLLVLCVTGAVLIVCLLVVVLVVVRKRRREQVGDQSQTIITKPPYKTSSDTTRSQCSHIVLEYPSSTGLTALLY